MFILFCVHGVPVNAGNYVLISNANLMIYVLDAVYAEQFWLIVVMNTVKLILRKASWS